MKVPFVNYGLQYKKIEKEIDEAIKKCLRNGDLILRDEVRKFEENFAKLVGAKYCLAVNSGTDACYLSLAGLGIEVGKEVITTWHTFEGIIWAIRRAFLKPVLVNPKKDFLINEEEIERKITPMSKVIIPVHLNGKICNMEKIKEIAVRNGLYIIEDSCQSIPKKLEGNCAFYSFYPAKILGAYGDSGAVVTNDEFLFKRMKWLRDAGFINSRLDNIQAAVLNVKLKHLPFYLNRRKEIALRYYEGLKEIEEAGLVTLPESEYWQNYVIRTANNKRLQSFLEDNGIETQIKGYAFDKSCITEWVLSLPLYPELTNKQVDYVIEKVREFFQK